jgi:hypothetical protein
MVSQTMTDFKWLAEKFIFSVGWDGLIDESLADYNNIIADCLEFLEPDPAAIQGIKDDWEDPVPEASTNISTLWIDPTPDSPVDIATDLASAARITDATNTFGDVINDQINSDVLPRFEAGMRDINAVMSSSFVIGRSVIEGMRDRDVAKFQADMYFKSYLLRDEKLADSHMLVDNIMADSAGRKNEGFVKAALQEDQLLAGSTIEKSKAISGAYVAEDKNALDFIKTMNLIVAEMCRHKTATVFQATDSHVQLLGRKTDYARDYSAAAVDSARIMYVMGKEYQERINEYYINVEKWPLEVFQHGANLLASVSGGTGYSPAPSAAQSALGGAFAGAGIGSRVSGGHVLGAGAGAILGGIGGYLLGR